VSVAYDYGYGPYTVEDLHGLPDNGRSYELVDGWLIELAPGPRHGFLARRLGRILEGAAEAAKARVYVQAPMDISTPTGARKPDVAVVDATAASSGVRRLGRSLYHGADVLLAVEVVSRGSGSERKDVRSPSTRWLVSLSTGSSTLTPNRRSRSCAAPATRDVTEHRWCSAATTPSRSRTRSRSRSRCPTCRTSPRLAYHRSRLIRPQGLWALGLTR